MGIESLYNPYRICSCIPYLLEPVSIHVASCTPREQLRQSFLLGFSGKPTPEPGKVIQGLGFRDAGA